VKIKITFTLLILSLEGACKIASSLPSVITLFPPIADICFLALCVRADPISILQ